MLLLNSDYDQNASGSTVGDKRQWYIQYNDVLYRVRQKK